MADQPNEPARTESGLPIPEGYRVVETGEGGGAATATATATEAPPTPPSALSESDWDRIGRMIADALRATNPPRYAAAPGAGGDAPPQLGGTGRGGEEPPHNLRTGPLNPNNPGTPNNDFIHGVKGKLKYVPPGTSGTPVVFDVEQYSFDHDLDTDDISNTSSGGWKIFLDGQEAITGQITFVYDSLNVPTVAPLPWRVRTYVELNLLPDGVTIWAFAALISKFSFSSGPKAGTVRVTCNYMSTGPVTFPTASQTAPTDPLS